MKKLLLILALALIKTGKEFQSCNPTVEYWMPALARHIQTIVKERL